MRVHRRRRGISGQDIRKYIEAVHRMNDLGAVIIHVANETSQEGSTPSGGDHLVTVDGDMVNRCEVFDVADLDAALARFEELYPPTPRLENTATRVQERVFSYIAAGDWDAVAQITAEKFPSTIVGEWSTPGSYTVGMPISKAHRRPSMSVSR